MQYPVHINKVDVPQSLTRREEIFAFICTCAGEHKGPTPPMPGVIEVHRETPIGVAIDELEIVLDVGTAEDLENQVKYISMR
jgi:hypothetical protein